jgi:hypothetical protein
MALSDVKFIFDGLHISALQYEVKKNIALHHNAIHFRKKKLKATQIYPMVRPAPLILNLIAVGTAFEIGYIACKSGG